MINFILSFMLLMNFYADFLPFQKDQNGNLYYQTSQEYPSKTKSQLYTGFRLWIAENFNQPQKVTVFEDEQTGTIILRPIIPFIVGSGYSGTELSAYFFLKVIFTDGKADFLYNNFEIWYPNGVKQPLQGYDKPIHFDKSGNMKPASYKTVGPYIESILNFQRSINL